MKHSPIPHGALVLVGDGKKALFFRNEGTPLHVNLVVERVLEQPDLPTREQGTSPPGRYASGSGPRSTTTFCTEPSLPMRMRKNTLPEMPLAVAAG